MWCGNLKIHINIKYCIVKVEYVIVVFFIFLVPFTHIYYIYNLKFILYVVICVVFLLHSLQDMWYRYSDEIILIFCWFFNCAINLVSCSSINLVSCSICNLLLRFLSLWVRLCFLIDKNDIKGHNPKFNFGNISKINNHQQKLKINEMIHMHSNKTA